MLRLTRSAGPTILLPGQTFRRPGMLRRAPRRYIVGGVTATGRRLLGLYVRPLLFAALEARAREHGWDFDIEVREILERAVRPRPTPLRSRRLRVLDPEEAMGPGET